MRRIAFALFLAAAAILSAQASMDDLRAAIVDTAIGLKGVPYVYGAESPPDALDCSGFVQYVFRKAAGLEIPRNSKEQWDAGYPITMSEIRPGDVFVFDTTGGGPSHVALYIGNGSMIQAASEGPQTGVIVSSTTDRYWAQRLLGARSFLDRPGAAAPSPPATPPAAASAAQAGAPPAIVGAPTPSPATPAVAGTAPSPPAAPPAAASAAQAGAPPAAASAAAVLPPASAAAPAVAASAASEPRGAEVPVSEIGFTLGTRPSVVTDRIPAAAGSMLAFTITNATGKSGKFEIDFYKADADLSKTVPLRHLAVAIAAGGHYRLDPYLFDEPGRYRLNVKTAGNIQLMQRSFEVVQIGKGGAIQAYAGQSAPTVAIPKGTPLTRVGLIVGQEPPEQGGSLRAARGSALVLRVANGTGVARDFVFLLYRMAKEGVQGAGGEVLSEQRARLPSGGWIELSPVLLSGEGSYRFVVKTGENDLLLQRTIVIDQ